MLTAFVAILCYGILNIGSYIDSWRFSERHAFVIPAQQEYITEADALMYARKTLEAEGYKIGDWELESEGYHTLSPNGEMDLYLNRASDPRSGRIQFRNANESGENRRFVEVEVTDNRVETYIWRPN